VLIVTHGDAVNSSVTRLRPWAIVHPVHHTGFTAAYRDEKAGAWRRAPRALCGCSGLPVHVKADAGAKRTLNMQRMSTASGRGMHMHTCTSNTSCMCMYVCLHVSVCLSVCIFLAPIACVTCSCRVSQQPKLARAGQVAGGERGTWSLRAASTACGGMSSCGRRSPCTMVRPTIPLVPARTGAPPAAWCDARTAHLTGIKLAQCP